MDSEGVYLCPECWADDEDARQWLSIQVEVEEFDPFDEGEPEHPYCESCSRFPSGRKMTSEDDVDRARDALLRVVGEDDQLVGEFERAVRLRAIGA